MGGEEDRRGKGRERSGRGQYLRATTHIEGGGPPGVVLSLHNQLLSQLPLACSSGAQFGSRNIKS